MVGFYIKKAFFDGWDNLIGLIILNLGFVAALAAAYGVLLAAQVNIVLGIVLAVAAAGLISVYTGAVSFFTRDYAFYQRPGMKDFVDMIRTAWKPSLLYAGIMLFLLVMVFFVIPFYAGFQGLLGAVIIALLFWIALFAAMALMYYFPIAAQLNDRGRKALKKSFLLVFDNIGFSFFLLFYTIINFIISVMTAFLIPGISSILMSHQIAVKLLMFKYDYLEENTEANRKQVPWSALLIDEKEKVGHRSLRGMIFPWKE